MTELNDTINNYIEKLIKSSQADLNEIDPETKAMIALAIIKLGKQ